MLLKTAILLTVFVVAKVDEILILNQQFATRKLQLSQDDSVVFILKNSSLSNDCAGAASAASVDTAATTAATSTTTKLKTFSEPGEYSFTTLNCLETLVITVVEYPQNPFLEKESIILEKYSLDMNKKNGCRKDTVAITFFWMLLAWAFSLS
jgi:hypothetical protein